VGVTGTAGVCGCTGVAGCSGILGMGVAGCSGILGMGVAGCSGILGAGVAGMLGVVGVRGVAGVLGVDGELGVDGDDGPAGDPGCPVFELVTEPDCVPVCVPVWVPVCVPVFVAVVDAVVVDVAVPPLLKLIELGSDMKSIPFVVETRFGGAAREDLVVDEALAALAGRSGSATGGGAGRFGVCGDRFCTIAIYLHMLCIGTHNRVSLPLKRQSR
jgi:hypothetical protein